MPASGPASIAAGPVTSPDPEPIGPSGSTLSGTGEGMTASSTGTGYAGPVAGLGLTGIGRGGLSSVIDAGGSMTLGREGALGTAMGRVGSNSPRDWASGNVAIARPQARTRARSRFG